MRRVRYILPVVLTAFAAMPGTVLAQTTTQTMTGSRIAAATRAAQPNGLVAPRTPGGISAGAVQGNQGRMDATVGGIDSRLLNQEKDRPRLPGQAPSPSQTLPGGTASGQTPR